MKIVNFILMFFMMNAVFAESSKYPVDFDESYFRKSPYSRWIRDPFKNPPGFSRSALTTAKWPQLSSVVIKNDVPVYAVLDGKRYREGQFISETRFISVIGQNYVIISEGNFDYELVLPDPQRSVAGSNSEVKK